MRVFSEVDGENLAGDECELLGEVDESCLG